MIHYQNLAKNANKIYVCAFDTKTHAPALKNQSRLSHLNQKIQRKPVSSPQEMRPLPFPKEWVDLLLRGKFPDGFLCREPSDKPRLFLGLEAREVFLFENPDYFLRVFLVKNLTKNPYALLPDLFSKYRESVFYCRDVLEPEGCARMFCVAPKPLSK